MTQIRKYLNLTCTCSDRQLEQVGCECGAQAAGVATAEIWLDGYASDNRAVLTCPERATNEQITEAVYAEFGYRVKIYHISRPQPVVASARPMSAEYIREMSQGG